MRRNFVHHIIVTNRKTISPYTIYSMSNIFFENSSIQDKIRQYISQGKVTSEKIMPEPEPEQETKDIKVARDVTSDYETYDTEDEYMESENDDDDYTDASAESSNSQPFETSTTYYYLDHDNGSLHYDFGLTDQVDDITKQYTVHLCSFKINELGPYPFILYLLQLDGETFKFPQFLFRSSSNLDLDDDVTEMTPRHVEFQNECMKRVLEFITLDEYENDIHELYKGFLEESYDGINHLYVFFDISEFELVSNVMHSPFRREWATINELTSLHSLLGYPIDPHIGTMFTNNESIQYISKNHSENMKTPTVMYLCKAKPDGTYENLYYDDDEVHFDRSIKDVHEADKGQSEDQDQDKYITFLHDRIAHPILGNFYILSVKPLDLISKSVFNIKRFVGFTLQPIHILKNLSNVAPENQAKSEFTLGMVIPTVVDYFAKSISDTNPEKNESSGENSSESTSQNGKSEISGILPKEPNEPRSSESTLQNEKPENFEKLSKVGGNPEEIGGENFEKKEFSPNMSTEQKLQQLKEELAEMDVSCVYFQEYIQGKRCAFWCIRSDDDFIEIM